MSEFAFNKAITIYPAFDAYLRNNFPTTFNGITGGSDTVTALFTEPLSEVQQATLSNLVSNYVNPSYWLELDHTESSPLMSEPTISPSNVLMQSIIVSQYGQVNIALDNMKTIVRYSAQDPAYFATWDSNQSPVTFNLTIDNYTTGNNVTIVSTNINNELATWKAMAQAGSNSLPDIFKTVQIYGLKDMIPNYDNIWLFKGSITNSNVAASLNSLQKLFYNVISATLQ